MAIRKACIHCGALAPAEACTCALCGRSVEGLEVFSTGNEDAYLDDDGVYQPGTEKRALPLGLDSGGVLGIFAGPIFVLAYPVLLVAWASQVSGSVASDALLGLCWLMPEVYVLTGVVKAAQMANRARGFAPALVVPGLSAVLQVLVFALARPSVPGGVSVFGLHGTTLVFAGPFAAYLAASGVAGLIAAWAPRVVPGKFQRVIGPQLGCLSILLVALQLPVWGGLALMRRLIAFGYSTVWVDVASLFVFSFFALIWFRPTD